MAVATRAGVSQEQSDLPSSNVDSSRQNAPSEATDPFRSNAGLPQPDADSSRAVDLSNRSIRELEVELRLALNDDTRTEILVRDGTIGEKERQQARGKVVLVTARLEGIADDLADEIDRLKLELTKKDAEIERAQAHSLMGAVQVARNKRLNERKAGMVSEDDVATAKAQYKVNEAQRSIVRAEKAEVELRIQQLRKRLGRIKAVIKLADPHRELKP